MRGRRAVPGLVALLLVLWAPAAWASGTIRVAIVEAARAVELRGRAIEVAELRGCEGCVGEWWLRGDVVRAAWTASGLEVDGQRTAGVRLRSGLPIRLNGREYTPPLEVVPNGGGVAVVSELPLEEYLAGVLRAEVGERWPVEALRAQAIAARTYAAYHRVLNAGKPYHIVASTAHQQYAGRVAASSPAWGAVLETTGQVLLWEGELFPAFYHTDSGGYTEDPRTVFGARNMPALRPVASPYSAGSPYFHWSLDLGLAELAELLRRQGSDVGAVHAIEVTERTASLRAATVTIRGSRGEVRLRGNDLRRAVGYDTLKSTLFAVAVDDTTAHFAGRGYGHGVGLCQWGARGMAEQGYTARQILAYYYPGTTFGFLEGR